MTLTGMDSLSLQLLEKVTYLSFQHRLAQQSLRFAAKPRLDAHAVCSGGLGQHAPGKTRQEMHLDDQAAPPAVNVVTLPAQQLLRAHQNHLRQKQQ